MQVYTENEIEYIKSGSILGAVLKNLADNPGDNKLEELG